MENNDKKMLANEKASKDVSSENSLSNDNENTKKPIRKVVKKDSSSKKKAKVRVVDSSDSATLSEESCLTSKKCKLNPNKQKKVKKLGVKNRIFDEKTIEKIENICDKHVSSTKMSLILAKMDCFNTTKDGEDIKSNNDYKIEDFLEDVNPIRYNKYEGLIFVKDIFGLFIDCIRCKKISYFNTLCYGLLRRGSIKKVSSFKFVFNKRICFNGGYNTKGILLLCVLEMLCEYLLNNKKNIFEKIFNELNINIKDLLNYRVSSNKTLEEYLNEIYTKIHYYLENKFDTKNGLLINYILNNLNKYNDDNFKDFLNINNENIDIQLKDFDKINELNKDKQPKTIKIKENTEKKPLKHHKENVIKITKKNTPVFNNSDTKQMHNVNICYPNSNYQPCTCLNNTIPQFMNTQQSNYIIPNQFSIPTQYSYSQNSYLPNISNQGFNNTIPQFMNTQQINYTTPNQIHIPIIQYGYCQDPINTFDCNNYNNTYNNAMFQPGCANLKTKHLNIQNNLNNTLANINNTNVFEIQLINSNINRDLVKNIIDNIRPVSIDQFIGVANQDSNELGNFLYFNYNDNIENGHLYFNTHNIRVIDFNRTTNTQTIGINNTMNNDGVYILHNHNHFTAVKRITHNGQVYFFGIDSMNNQNFMDDFLNIYPNSIIVNTKLDTVQQNIYMNRDEADRNACAIWAYTNAIALYQMDLNSVIQNGYQCINLSKINTIEIQEIQFQIENNVQNRINNIPALMEEENNGEQIIDVDMIMENEGFNDININRQNDVNNVPVLMEDENNREQIIDVDMIMDNEGFNDINTYEKANEEFDEIFDVDHSKSID